MIRVVGPAVGRQLVRLDAELPEIIPGQVDPPVAGVVADVAEDVGQLQRDAAVLGEPLGLAPSRAISPDMQAAQSDHRCHVIAVVRQLGEGCEAPRLDVHRDPLDDLVEQGCGDRMPSHGNGQGRRVLGAEAAGAGRAAASSACRQASSARAFSAAEPGSSAKSSVCRRNA